MKPYSSKTCTHRDPVYLRVVGLVVVAVKGFFANSECSLDCERVFVIDGSCGEVLVDVVHSRYDSCNTRGPS